MFGSDKGVVIPAAWSGKIKTASQLIGLSLSIIDRNPYLTFLSGKVEGAAYALNLFSSLFITIAVLATVYSFFDYTKALKKYIDPTK